MATRQYRQAEAAFRKTEHSYSWSGHASEGDLVNLRARAAAAAQLRNLPAAAAEPRIGDISLQRNPLAGAAKACRDAAVDDIALENYARAVGSAKRAATHYTQANRHFDAGEAWERVAHAHLCCEEKDGAGARRVQDNQAVDMANAAYRRAGLPERGVADDWRDSLRPRGPHARARGHAHRGMACGVAGCATQIRFI